MGFRGGFDLSVGAGAALASVVGATMGSAALAAGVTGTIGLAVVCAWYRDLAAVAAGAEAG